MSGSNFWIDESGCMNFEMWEVQDTTIFYMRSRVCGNCGGSCFIDTFQELQIAE